jgi:hypothetical protein
MNDTEWARVVAYAERESISLVEAMRRLIAKGADVEGIP